VGAESKLIKTFLGEAFARHEVGQHHWEWWKREEGVDGYAADIAEIFREHSGDGSDFLVDRLVFENESCGIDGWKWRRKVLSNAEIKCGRRRRRCMVEN